MRMRMRMRRGLVRHHQHQTTDDEKTPSKRADTARDQQTKYKTRFALRFDRKPRFILCAHQHSTSAPPPTRRTAPSTPASRSRPPEAAMTQLGVPPQSQPPTLPAHIAAVRCNTTPTGRLRQLSANHITAPTAVLPVQAYVQKHRNDRRKVTANQPRPERKEKRERKRRFHWTHLGLRFALGVVRHARNRDRRLGCRGGGGGEQAERPQRPAAAAGERR